MADTNLLKETQAYLERRGKKTREVLWCGSETFGWFTWADFENLAQNLIYDDGFGAQEIARDLLIVGDDWWLEREEYDGSEGWRFKVYPTMSKDYRIPKKMTGAWSTLEDIDKSERERQDYEDGYGDED